MGKYFIKDVALKNSDKDKFRHCDIAEVIKNIIDNTKSPYNIAVIGKWGLGKSTLINIALQKYRNNTEDFIVHEINAWKYEKEALTKVFLKQLCEQVDGEKIESFHRIKKRYAEIVYAINEKLNKGEKRKNKITFFIWLAIFIVAFILIFFGAEVLRCKLDNLPVFNKEFWLKTVLKYFDNFFITIISPILISMIIPYLTDMFNIKKQNVSLNLKIQGSDEYEMLLSEAISKKIKKNKNFKVITVIDDLDRLSINKMVEALDAIKAFVGFTNCIFIVPFDDAILKEALEKKRINGLNDNGEEIESELILDKLFQFKIYLPPLLDFNIKNYAKDLVKQEIPHFFEDYCNQDLMIELMNHVLIHAGVTTPRQVKKIINIFVSNCMVAKKREFADAVERGFFTNNESKYQIAKISVLQADFNEFYDKLFEDYEIIDNIVNREYKEILNEYFEDDKATIKKEHFELVNFLSWTSKYSSNNIGQYLKLAQDEFSQQVGGDNMRLFTQALGSGNIVYVRECLENDAAYVKAIRYSLQNPNPGHDENILKTTLLVFDAVDDDYKNDIATLVTKKYQEVKSIIFAKADSINIIDIYINSVEKRFRNVFMEDYIKSINGEFELDDETQKANINLLESYKELDKRVNNKVNDLTMKRIGDTSKDIEDIIEIRDLTKQRKIEEFSFSILKRLVKEFVDELNTDEVIISTFEEIFIELKESENINNLLDIINGLFELPKLYDVLNKLIKAEDKNRIDKKLASDLANKIIESSLETESKEYGLQLLNKLNYNSDELIEDKYDTYFESIAKTEITKSLLDNILYCCENGDINLFNKTLNIIYNNFNKREDTCNTLKNIYQYLDDTNKKKIDVKLKAYSQFNAISQDNNLLYKACEVVSVDKARIDALIAFVIAHFTANADKPNYFDFTIGFIATMIEDINGPNTDRFINKIKSLIPSHYDKCIRAINAAKIVLLEKHWLVILPLIMKKQYLNESNYRDTFELVKYNKNIFTEENDNMDSQIEFLVNTMDISNDPNDNVRELNEYLYISRYIQFIDNCIKYSIDKFLARKSIAKFFSNDNENRINELNNILDNDERTSLLFESISALVDFNIDGMLKEYYNQHITDNVIDKIIRIIKTCIRFNKISSDVTLMYINYILETYLEDTDVIHSVEQIINKVNKSYFDVDKLISNLYRCFVDTSNREVQSCVVRLLRHFKLLNKFVPKIKNNGELLSRYKEIRKIISNKE